MSYYGSTFLVSNADEFATSPESFIPNMIKATTLWSNSAYWLGPSAQPVPCACM